MQPFLERYSKKDTIAPVVQPPEDILQTLSPTEAAEWIRKAAEYDLPSKDLFATVDQDVLAALDDDEENDGNKKPAAVAKPTDAPEPSLSRKTAAPIEPSPAMLNFQRSFAMLSNEEQRLFNQVTPSTAGEQPESRLWSTAGNPHSTLWRTPASDTANISNISDISELSTGTSHLLQQPILPPDFHQNEQPASSTSKASATSTFDETVDPLEAIMCSSRLTIYKELIKELAFSAAAATDALQQKMSAAAKLHDPLINPTPRSIRNNLFTLTTIAEFRDHENFKLLQMKAAGFCEQYKANLAATIRELATNEITWLKILRVQHIVQKLKPIIASLVFKLDHITIRPKLPELVTQDTIHFFVLYWLIQLNSQMNHQCYSTFFGLPLNDIAATAATILIENNPIAIGQIVENLNEEALNWDKSNKATGYYVTTILRDLDAIINAAVFDYVTYNQAKKNTKKVEAQVQAFVNKLRVKNTTVLTNETLAKVTKQVKTDNINEQDLRRRQLELETIIAKQNERINHFVKEHQQKNSQGSFSAQRPSQLKLKTTQHPTTGYGTIRFTPAQPAIQQLANATPAPQETTRTDAPQATGRTTNQKQQKKKRKYHHKK
jgi:hypothetical protein